MSILSSIKAVQDLGLTENEAKVYVHALALGPTTALAVARRAGMYRPTVYAALDTLKQKGLVHEEILGVKKLFAAEKPEKLELLLQRTRTEFDAILPELEALYTARGESETVSTYSGLEAVKVMYAQLMRDLTHKDFYYAISNEDRWYDLDEKFFGDIAKQTSAKRLDFRMILQDSERARYVEQYQKNFGMHIKLVPKDRELTTGVVVTPKHVMIHTLTHPTSAILIQNHRAIDMQRQVFTLMWEALPDSIT